MANHPPVTTAVLQQHLQQQSQQLFLQLSQLLDDRIRLRCVGLFLTSPFCVVFGHCECCLCSSEARQQARIVNSLVAVETALEVILDANGAAPPHWPAGASSAQVRQIPGTHINQILQFYQLSTQGPVSDRRRRLLIHLGVRI